MMNLKDLTASSSLADAGLTVAFSRGPDTLTGIAILWHGVHIGRIQRLELVADVRGSVPGMGMPFHVGYMVIQKIEPERHAEHDRPAKIREAADQEALVMKLRVAHPWLLVKLQGPDDPVLPMTDQEREETAKAALRAFPQHVPEI